MSSPFKPSIPSFVDGIFPKFFEFGTKEQSENGPMQFIVNQPNDKPIVFKHYPYEFKVHDMKEGQIIPDVTLISRSRVSISDLLHPEQLSMFSNLVDFDFEALYPSSIPALLRRVIAKRKYLKRIKFIIEQLKKKGKYKKIRKGGR